MRQTHSMTRERQGVIQQLEAIPAHTADGRPDTQAALIPIDSEENERS